MIAGSLSIYISLLYYMGDTLFIKQLFKNLYDVAASCSRTISKRAALPLLVVIFISTARLLHSGSTTFTFCGCCLFNFYLFAVSDSGMLYSSTLLELSLFIAISIWLEMSWESWDVTRSSSSNSFSSVWQCGCGGIITKSIPEVE